MAFSKFMLETMIPRYFGEVDYALDYDGRRLSVTFPSLSALPSDDDKAHFLLMLEPDADKWDVQFNVQGLED